MRALKCFSDVAMEEVSRCEQSDMDMAVRGLDISDRTTLIEDMHTLTQALDAWDLVEKLVSIETASIPVIKAQIDLKQIRKLIK